MRLERILISARVYKVVCCKRQDKCTTATRLEADSCAFIFWSFHWTFLKFLSSDFWVLRARVHDDDVYFGKYLQTSASEISSGKNHSIESREQKRMMARSRWISPVGTLLISIVSRVRNGDKNDGTRWCSREIRHSTCVRSRIGSYNHRETRDNGLAKRARKQEISQLRVYCELAECRWPCWKYERSCRRLTTSDRSFSYFKNMIKM